MIHLIRDNVSAIENNLIWVKTLRDSLFSWWFNIILLTVVVGSFSYFLYASYGTVEEPKQVKFEPRLWNNAVKNVPLREYGQTPQVETGDGISGFARRTSATDF